MTGIHEFQSGTVCQTGQFDPLLLTGELAEIDHHVQHLAAGFDISVIDIHGVPEGFDFGIGQFPGKIVQLVLQIVAAHIDDVNILFHLLVLLSFMIYYLLHYGHSGAVIALQLDAVTQN